VKNKPNRKNATLDRVARSCCLISVTPPAPTWSGRTLAAIEGFCFAQLYCISSNPTNDKTPLDEEGSLLALSV